MAVRAAKLLRHYKGSPEPALRGISLSVPTGSTLVLVGPSGSGKSTLLNLIGGLDAADAGALEVCGEDLSHESGRAAVRGAMVGTVFQHHLLAPGLTAEDAVAAPLLWTRQFTPEQAVDRARRVLEALGLFEEERQRRVQHLSGGQRQRVAFARAIAPDPQVLLADEPTSQLDTATAGLLLDLLKSWRSGEKAAHRTLIVATHDPSLDLGPNARKLRVEGGLLIGEKEAGPGS